MKSQRKFRYFFQDKKKSFYLNHIHLVNELKQAEVSEQVASMNLKILLSKLHLKNHYPGE